jgi:hypothetical protein
MANSDLIPKSLSLGSSSVTTGGSLTVNWTMLNQGTGTAPATTTGIRITTSSTDHGTSANDVGSLGTQQLTAGASVAQSDTIIVPTIETVGTDYVWVVADNENPATGNQGSNTGNDYQLVGSIQVTGGGGGGGGGSGAPEAGLDMTSYSGTQTSSMINNTNLQFIGYYFAPTENQNRINATWMGERQTLMDQGWKIEPLYLCPASSDVSLFTNAEGKSEGQEAANFMASEGFVKGSNVFLDFEFNISGVSMQPSYMNYIEGWIDAVSAAGFQPGIYVSRLDGSLIHQDRPDALIWAWDHVTNASRAGTIFPTSDPNSASYSGAFIEQYNVQTLLSDVPTTPTVDLDVMSGTVVGGPGNDIYSYVVGFNVTTNGVSHHYVGDGAVTIDEQGQGGTDVLRVYSNGVVTNATDLSYQIAPNGNDLIIHPVGDTVDVITIKNMSQASSQVETLAIYNQAGALVSQINLVDKFDALVSGGGSGVAFNVSPQSGAEGSALTFRISIQNPNYAVTLDYLIYYNTSDGTATAGSDYNGIANQVAVHFTASSPQSVDVTVQTLTDNNPNEGSETFNFNVYDNQHALLTQVQGTITDVQVNHIPQVDLPSGASVLATAAQTLQVSSLFHGSDADNDTLTYFLYDANTAANSGHFVVGGNVVPAQTITQVSAAQLALATFVAGAAGTSDDIYVEAYDGKAYSGWNAGVHVAVNTPPQVDLPSGASVSATAAQTLQVSSLFHGSDADNDTLTYYLYDANAAANSGHFVVGGNAVPAQTITPVSAAQLALATFVAGAAGTSDDIYVEAYDGKAYSGWNADVHVAVAANNTPPQVDLPSGASVPATAAQTLQVSSLFHGSDADNDALTYYLYDANPAANSGHFVVGGNVVPAQTITPASAAQLALATFVAGAAGTSDDIYVEAYDGKAYSGWNAGVHVAVAADTPPQVNLPSGANVSTTPTQTLQVSSLFSGSDLDGDTLTYYVYDASPAANSGHFVVGGNVVPAQTITPASATQLAQATFVAGAAGTSDDLYVEAYDGHAYSGWNAGVHVAVAANTPPQVNLPSGTNVSATPGQTLQVSSLFSGSDLDGDTLTYYVYDASPAANSGHFVVGGNVVPAQTITPASATQLAQATFVAGAAGTSDDLYVEAYDGHAYSGWNAGVHILV